MDRVGHAAHRVDDEGQIVVAERVAAIGAAELFGIVGRARQGDRPALRHGGFDGRRQAGGVAGLHAIEPAAAFGRHQRRVQRDALDPPSECSDHARYDQSARGVSHEDDAIGDVGRLDVGDDRGDLVVDGDGGEVRRVGAAAGEVDGDHTSVEQRRQAVPEPGGRAAAVDEHVRHG